MNYAPNTEPWKVGDLVIHDCDAKEERMLMRVVGFTLDGMVKTKYEFLKTKWGKQDTRIYINPTASLHNPKRWGIEV